MMCNEIPFNYFTSKLQAGVSVKKESLNTSPSSIQLTLLCSNQ